MAVGDFNGDGRLDLVTANIDSNDVSVLLGNGDGSFREQRRFAAGRLPISVSVGDFNGDGQPDLAVANVNSVSVLLGQGDGTFPSAVPYAAGDAPVSVAVGDFNGDGKQDLATANFNSDNVSVLLGNGNGSFQGAVNYDAGDAPVSLAVGDFNGDTKQDLAVANTFGGTVSVLLGNGGSFQSAVSYAAGSFPASVTVGDFNRDGRLDLVTANGGGDDVSVLLGNGTDTDTFQSAVHYAAGDGPESVAVGDFNGDGRQDLAVTSSGTRNFVGNNVSVLLGQGDGSFREQRRFATGNTPFSVAAADVDGDGRLDLVTANINSNDVSVLLGNGDGSFREQRRFVAGRSPNSVVTADVDGDGRLDLIIANAEGDVSVLLGNGGSFREQRRFAAGTRPLAVAAADVDGDGRLDLVTANAADGDVSVLLGNGDGSFREQRRFALGRFPNSVAVGDFNGDGRPDLVVAGGVVAVLLNNGDGSFQPAVNYAAGDAPASVAVGDFNRDGKLDLVTANFNSDDVSVLLGNGDGSFQVQRRFAAGDFSRSVSVGDFNGDGKQDLVVANLQDFNVSVLLGKGDGTFQSAVNYDTGFFPGSVAVGDFNRDGRLDLVTPNRSNNDVSVLLGNGDGSFQEQRRFAAGDTPTSVAVGDFNGDGRLDLVTANSGGDDVSVLLGNGLGADEALFSTFTAERSVDVRHTPHRADLDRDGIADTVVLNKAGEILFRRGLSGRDNLYAPPVVLNPGAPARDLALLSTGAGPAVVAADTRTDTVSVYVFNGTTFQPALTIPTGRLPARLGVADLDGNGLDDVVSGNALDGTVTVALQQPGGTFAGQSLAVGVVPSDIAFANVDGKFGPDIVLVDRASGDATVLYNDPARSFSRSARYRAGLSVTGLPADGSTLRPRSGEEPIAVVAGRFTADAALDLVVVNRAAHHFLTLAGIAGGGFTNPTEDFRVSTSRGFAVNDRPGPAVAADFDRDGKLDVAVLMEDRGEVWLYRGLGDGRFELLVGADDRVGFAAGNEPTGLAAEDVNGDGLLDLMVGNGFGDVLFLLGNGAGSFASFVRSDNRLSFVATDLDGNGTTDVVLARQANDTARSLTRRQRRASFVPGEFRLEGKSGLIGPGDVTLADLDGRFGTDLIFANTGSNNVVVYLRTQDGSFSTTSVSFFAGTNPTDLHIAQLNDDNGDGRVDGLDLIDLAVANQGSNDVSVLLGSRDRDVNRDGTVDGRDLFRLGPRLATVDSDATTSAGDVAGPSFVSSRDLNGDGIPDILAASTRGSTATLVPGRGSGSFNDTGRTPVALGATPRDIDNNFLLLDDGRIVEVTFGAVETRFTPDGRQPVAFEAVDAPGFASPVFFTLNSDGTASMLTANDGALYTELDSVDAGGLDTPGALAVLEGSNGFEVYALDAQDGDLIVLPFDAGVGPGIAVGPGETVAGVVPVGGSEGLALVATLTSSLVVQGLLPEAMTATVDPVTIFGLEEAADLVVVDGVFISAGEEILLGLEDDGTEEVGDESPAPAEPDSVQDFLSGLDEALRRLGWKHAEEAGPAPDLPEAVHHWLGYAQELVERVVSVFQHGEHTDPPIPGLPTGPAEPEVFEDTVPEGADERAASTPVEETPTMDAVLPAAQEQTSGPARPAAEAGELTTLLTCTAVATGLCARGSRRDSRRRSVPALR